MCEVNTLDDYNRLLLILGTQTSKVQAGLIYVLANLTTSEGCLKFTFTWSLESSIFSLASALVFLLSLFLLVLVVFLLVLAKVPQGDPYKNDDGKSLD